jgi:hypothetical protein
MKRIINIILLIAPMFVACTHKELCMDHRSHAHKYHVAIAADYIYEWQENFGYRDWESTWPEDYISYDGLRPTKPTGIRVINYNSEGASNIHNIGPDGGIVNLYEGHNDILFYNNDTEYIIFSRADNNATTRATTRARTRATYEGNPFTTTSDKEETVTPPDMLYGRYLEGYYAEKLLDPAEIDITLHPLVFTYKIRYEFEKGLEYVAIARGALSGMARSVLMNTGETSEQAGTLLYDCEVKDYGVGATVKSFGIPAFPNSDHVTKSPGRHALNLEVLLKNGSTLTFDFDVTTQVEAQPHGGVITVSGIVIKPEDGTQGSGAFDVTVDDWGPYEDICLPL